MKLPAVVSNGDDGGGVSVCRVLSLTAATPSPLPSPSVSRPPAYSYFPPYDSLYLGATFRSVDSRNTGMHYKALLAGHV